MLRDALTDRQTDVFATVRFEIFFDFPEFCRKSEVNVTMEIRCVQDFWSAWRQIATPLIAQGAPEEEISIVATEALLSSYLVTEDLSGAHLYRGSHVSPESFLVWSFANDGDSGLWGDAEIRLNRILFRGARYCVG
jgi:hypothetical protein